MIPGVLRRHTALNMFADDVSFLSRWVEGWSETSSRWSPKIGFRAVPTPSRKPIFVYRDKLSVGATVDPANLLAVVCLAERQAQDDKS